MAVIRHLWVGTGALPDAEPEGIWRITNVGSAAGWADAPVVRAHRAAEPTFLALHPAADRVYAVAEQSAGRVTSFTLGADCALGTVRSVATGGANPCHLRVHPQGQWLYAANYGDGVLSAIELTEAGDVSDHVLTFAHTGSGPDADRQQGPHAHSTRISPGGDYLLVADLGTDEIRAYPLDGGRPGADPVISAMPPGSGPRHFAGKGSYLYVSAELSGQILVLAWDEDSGTAQVVQQIPGATLPGRSADAHYLSHILYTRGVVLVASRGSDSISTFTVHDDGARLQPAGEIHTGAWPRHMAVAGANLIVAAEHGNEVLIHPFTPEAVSPAGGPGAGAGADAVGAGAVGPAQHAIGIRRPMFILPM